MGLSRMAGMLVLAAGACSQVEDAAEPVETKGQPLYVLTTALWPNGIIPVCWDTVGLNVEKDWVRGAVARTWESVAQLSFTGWGLCPSGTFPGLRIQWYDNGEAPHTHGLGTQIKGWVSGMTLNPTFKNWDRYCSNSESQRQSCIELTAVHEMGHALGFSHEQNRPDTPTWCTKPKQGTDGNATFGDWDVNSVMSYCGSIASSELSETDIAGVVHYYGAPICSGASGGWKACRGSGCAVCAESLSPYPLYTFNHPKCVVNTTCGGQFYDCSANCPAPSEAADTCPGSDSEWEGCRGHGCSVCSDRIAAYPNYLKRHPKCVPNSTCAGQYWHCSSNCPAPTAADQ